MLVSRTIHILCCGECGQELTSADEYSLHKRKHLMEHWSSTADGRRTLELLRAGGFVDRPDPALRRRSE
ncbi:MAG: hypothetical protein ACYSR6_11915 [Planctomycetota bacterium]